MDGEERVTGKDNPTFNFNFTKLVLHKLKKSNVTVSLIQNYQDSLYKKKSLYFTSTMLTICPLAMVINLIVILSSFRIRRPLTPTIYLSISLATADFYSSVTWILYLIVFYLLPDGLDINVEEEYKSCVWMTIEVLRLSSILVIVAHLWALAVNQYLGTLKPLHYPQILTHRKATILICILWTLPHIFLIAYFFSVSDQGYQSEYCLEVTFLFEKSFHITFSSMLIVPLIIMVFIYIHIFVMVRRHQVRRLRWISARHCDVEDQNFKQIQWQMTRNMKAIKTTLFILGSYAIGLLPTVVLYLITCFDCPIYPLKIKDEIKFFNLFLVVNVLLVTKTIVNPFIYATRMKEVKVALSAMCQSVLRKSRFLNRFQESDTSLQRTQQTTCPVSPT